MATWRAFRLPKKKSEGKNTVKTLFTCVINFRVVSNAVAHVIDMLCNLEAEEVCVGL
ncbi:similarity to THIOREDOXIN REDUCTASE [Encephalitozoon cuniculi GB-M1]|uniref:Similarity to THIOREDOXIN REDUCTASE n=1 Tax=Encephalitozoon cuniculi (strain GB-M1) TaxID=284813 RepID=Q8SWM4_ENCCU|nr:uncharacterized protein ECU01_0660 [Encephalitozoon cuniculi GB-M1]CAD24936.2 similarity to THIOREDOXIN REDUCTASE [Encephalitozoon cuniculi GB-M1]